MTNEEFLELLANGAPNVTVVGGGYVGLPLAVEAAANGCNVTVLDIDIGKVEKINAGKSYIDDVKDAQLKQLVDAGVLCATSNVWIAYRDVHAVLICVPTPLQPSREPDISLVDGAVEGLCGYLRGAPTGGWPLLVVLESTVHPGCTREEIAPRLREATGTRRPVVFVAFSPERIDPSNHSHHVGNTAKVVGGTDPVSTEAAKALYRRVVSAPIVPVSTSDAAELVKLLENTYRAVNIALANEFAMVARKLGIDIWEVIDAAATKPFGFQRFVPGCGVGGHCIGPDPVYLSAKMHGLNEETRLLDTAVRINSAMPRYAVQRLADLLNEDRRPLRGQCVYVVGVAYKPGVSDTRESPALDIIRELERRGAEVHYFDPHVPTLAHEGIKKASANCGRGDSFVCDATIIATAHADVDYAAVLSWAPLCLDTRGITRGMATPPGVKVELL